MTESTTSPPPFAFAPVPCRARHDGWTPERQTRFIQALAATDVVTAAAKAVGMSAKSAYALLKRAGEDSGFARAWDAALDRSYRDALTDSLGRLVHGEQIPVFYRGRQVGSYRRFNDRLALATMRAVAAREERRKAEPRRPSDQLDPAERLHLALQAIGSSTPPGDPRDL